MLEDEFNQVINEQVAISLDLLVNKNSGYNPGEDKLHNFKVAAALQGVSTRQALAGMMAKHTTSVYDMCASYETFDEETWGEKLTDSINYLLLLKAVLVEERKELTSMGMEDAEAPVPPVPTPEALHNHYYFIYESK